MNQVKFVCPKCGREVKVEAPELTEAQAKKLHKCKEAL